MILLLAALAAQSVTAPDILPPDPVPQAAPSSHSVAAEDLREMAAIVGRQMAGRPVSGPFVTADKLLLIARNDQGEPIVSASFALPSRQSLPAPPAGTLAIVRLHQKMLTVVPGPTADDLAFVAANKVPLYVVGEWARPAPVWEVAFVDDAVRYRAIGEVGEIGPWQD